MDVNARLVSRFEDMALTLKDRRQTVLEEMRREWEVDRVVTQSGAWQIARYRPVVIEKDCHCISFVEYVSRENA